MIGMKHCIHKERNYDNKRLALTTKAKTYLTEAIDDRLRYISTITSQNQTLYVIFVHERSVGRINIENNYSATKSKEKENKVIFGAGLSDRTRRIIIYSGLAGLRYQTQTYILSFLHVFLESEEQGHRANLEMLFPYLYHQRLSKYSVSQKNFFPGIKYAVKQRDNLKELSFLYVPQRLYSVHHRRELLGQKLVVA